MPGRRGLWLSLAIVAGLLLLGRGLAQAYAARAEHLALGAGELWRLRALYTLLLRGAAGLAGGAFAALNLWFVRRSVVSLVLPRRMGNIEIGEEVPGRRLMSLVWAGAALLGVLAALPADDWQALVLAVHGRPFGEFEPYFAADAGYFVYHVPFERALHGWTLYAVSITGLAVVGLYALTPSLRLSGRRVVLTTYVRRHLAALAAVYLVLLGWRCRLDAFALVLEGHGAHGAFAAVDRGVLLPASILLFIAALAAAILVLWSGWVGHRRVAVGTLGAVVLGVPAVRVGVPAIAQGRALEGAAAERERPYLATRDEFTRRGFGVERVPPSASGEPRDPATGAALAPLWEAGAVLRVVTRRWGEPVGAAALAMAGDRPAWLAVTRPGPGTAAQSDRWRLVRVLARDADAAGGAVLADARGFVPLDEAALAAPVVHPGAEGAAIVSAPAAGPRLGGWVSRLAHAWSEQDLRLLGDAGAGEVVVARRDVHARVATVAPFLVAAGMAHPVVHGDTLWWALDLYAVTREFPLARPLPFASVADARYVRHAALALVDAHRATVRLVVGPEPDPLTATWIALVPGLFAAQDALAPAVAAQLPPLEELARVQAQAFGLVGSSADAEPRAFVPAFDGADAELAGQPPTPVVWGGATATVIPLVDRADRVQGAMVGTGGPLRAVGWHASEGPPTRWNDVLRRVRQAFDTVAVGNGESLVRGGLRMVPTAAGPAWVATLYAWAAEGPPRVVAHAIALGDSVVVRQRPPTADGAFDETSPDAVRARIRALTAELRDALRRGDWMGFGRALEALERLGQRP